MNLTITCKAIKKDHALSSLRAKYKQSYMLKDSRKQSRDENVGNNDQQLEVRGD